MERYTINPKSQHPNSLALFGKFSIFRTFYKLIDDQPIHVFFIVPDQLPSGPRPLLVRFHGGGGVEGEAEASIRPLLVISCLPPRAGPFTEETLASWSWH